MSSRSRVRFRVLLAGVMLAAVPAAAGTITVQWDPVADADLAGYTVYYGTTPGSHASRQDAGMSTSTTLTNVADCTIHYAAVRAYDTGGLESTADSNSIKGFPRPIVTGVAPNGIRRGETKTFTVTGTNFDAGVAGDATRPAGRVRTSNAGLTVTSSRVDACGQMTVTIQASSTAATGYVTLYVENPDLSYGDPGNRAWVFGQLANAINVTAASTDTTAPVISSTSPAAGATNVATSVRPTVTFSEGVAASSVTTSTVQLLNASGAAIAQAAGSPSVAGSVVTITPAAALGNSATYRIWVRGGSSGVKDLAGNPLASDYTQAPGFTTAASPSNVLSVVSTAPAAGALRVPTATTTFRITYSHDVSTLWSNLAIAELKQTFRVTLLGRPLDQIPASPSHENGGKTVVITIAGALQANATYRTEAGPLGAAGQNALRQRGIDPGVLKSTWYTNPGWTTDSAVVGTYSRDTAAPTEAATALTIPENPNTLPAENTGLATTSEFYVDFARPVAPSRVTAGIFRLTDESGAAVTQMARPRLENGGTRVVVTPARPLDPGSEYRFVIRTGPSGVAFVQEDGSLLTLGDRHLIVPVATRVSGSQQDPGVAP